VLLYSACSCGARRVNKQSTKEEIKTELVDNSTTEKQSETNVKTTTTVKVDDKNETVTEETVYEPSNNTKESFVIEKDGTKVILNNAKKIVRKTTKNNNTKTELVNNIDELKKEVQKEQKDIAQKTVSVKENSSKEIKKEPVPWYYFIIVLAVLGIIYWLLKKFRII
jgi:ABC-type Na+ efflux pump permease subunit